MDKTKTQAILEAAAEALIASTPIVGAVSSILLDATKDTEAAAGSGELEKLLDEAKRQELSLHMAKMQAQVAQELAIAHRIENANEVKIEEYYEGEGKGGLDASTDGASLSVALGGQGRKVTKRVYRFTGNSVNEQKAE